MPFHCKICDLDILSGTPMVSNDRNELAHDDCVKSVILHRISSPRLEASSKPTPPTPKSTSAPEPCTPASKPSVCVECGDPCIGMCPICLKLRCQAYGWNGKTCGVSHEGKCPGAAELREPLKKPVVIPILIGKPTNGKHVSQKSNGKRGRR